MIAVYELPPDSLPAARSVFSDAWFDRAQIDAVFEGRQPGRVFVDDLEQPSAAIMFRTYGFYVAGDHGNAALRRFIRDAPPEPGVFQSLYGYVPDGDAWKQALLEDHGDVLEVIPRHGFSWQPTPEALVVIEGWRDRMPAGIRMVAIDADLARRIDHEMPQFIESFWLSYDAFAKHGFGYCLMSGNEIASVAYTISVSSTEANIDVETAPGYRRQGLSMLTCSAYIERCLALGITPTWDADGNNLPSRALARKLGFQEHPMLATQLSPPRGSSLLGATGIWMRDGQYTWHCQAM